MKLKQSAWLLLLLLLPTTTTVIAQSGLWVERVRLCLLGQQKAPFWPLKASYSRNSSSKEPRIRWPNNQQNGGGGEGGRPLFFSSLRKFGLKQTSSHERLLKLKTEKCSVTNSMRFHSLKKRDQLRRPSLEAYFKTMNAKDVSFVTSSLTKTRCLNRLNAITILECQR